MELSGRAALVTGAASGIGRATSLRLASAGVRVALVDVDGDGLDDVSSAIGRTGSEALALRADVTSWDALADAFHSAESAFGGLHIVHNNAGINTGRPRFPDSPRARWELTLAIDLWAVMAGCQLAVAALRRRGGGAIVNTASLAAVTPFAADPAYAAAKAGVVNLTRSLAFLRSESIPVNCICPGVVDTRLLSKRDLSAEDEAIIRSIPLLQPDEVAAAVVEVVKDDSLAGAVFGLLPGRPSRAIPPQLVFQGDPTSDMES